MKLQSRMRFGLAAALVVGSLAAITPAAMAQPPGGNFQLPPDMMAKIKAWQKWNENNKNIDTLNTTMYQVREIDKVQETKLDKKQAGTLLSILQSWRKKPVMTNDQARQVNKQISGMMTQKQLKRMTTFQPPWKRQAGGRPGGGGAGGGGPRPAGGGGGRPNFTIPDPPKGGYNPLNPDTLPFVQMRPQAKKGLDDFAADLTKRAK